MREGDGVPTTTSTRRPLVARIVRPGELTVRVAFLVGAYAAAAFFALLATARNFPPAPGIALPFSIVGLPSETLGIALWTVIALLSAAWGQREEGRVALVPGAATIIAAIALGGPTAAAWVALIGTLELRELRGDIPWYGVLANHAMQVAPAVLAGFAYWGVAGHTSGGGRAVDFPATAVAAVTFWTTNTAMAAAMVWARTGRHPSVAYATPWGALLAWMVAETAIGWLASICFEVVWWSPFAVAVANASTAASLASGQAGWLLRHHQLTELPNARSLREHGADLRRGNRRGVCAFYIDLDGFKAVNDRYGHDAGDDVLVEVGRRLRAAKRAEDFVAHLHGDEFVLLAQGIGSDAEAADLIERVQDEISLPIHHNAGTIAVGASVGYQFVTNLDQLDEALREADHNMGAAKMAHAAAAGRTRRSG